MMLNNFIKIFLPRDKVFFTLFEQSAANLTELGKVLVEFLNTNDPVRKNDLIRTVEELEHNGDRITHQIFQELGTNFITPFDREDIHYLASSLDDIADFIYGSAKRVGLYRLQTITPEMKKLGDLILQSITEIENAVRTMRDMSDILRIKEACVRINSIENQADDVFDRAIADLFEHEKDAINLIKQHEILSCLETATDKCEDVANVIDSILIKNS